MTVIKVSAPRKMALRADRAANVLLYRVDVPLYGRPLIVGAFTIVLAAESPDGALEAGQLLAEEATALLRPAVPAYVNRNMAGQVRPVRAGGADVPAVEGVTLHPDHENALPAWDMRLRTVTEDGLSRDTRLRVYAAGSGPVHDAADQMIGYLIEASGDAPSIGDRAVGRRWKIAASEPVRVGRLVSE